MDYKHQQHFKAVISNHGDETLYEALSSEVERRLPAAPVSWKRSYGRPSKEVVLQANFLKFDSSQLSSTVDSASTLTSKPLLHIFWTSCLDNDKYKSAVKSRIVKWQKVLSENRSADWLIVHVVFQDNTKQNKSKINLPRSSVYDKIKTEFGQKLQDRCVQLWEPDKETLFTKSGESWDALLSQLRNLLLESFGRHLDSFEDRIRVMREKYADPEWPFIDYFVVHEELALIYQSITLCEDALVQYDEVDALLSQFIINCSGRELPKWLEKYCVPPTNWDGVSLSSQNVEKYKALIKSGNASLIDFRNYLFSRQCKLLIANDRKGMISSRLMEFMFMAVQELVLLKVDTQVGSVACWTVLTCMQLFQVVDTVENKDYEFQSTFAHMYDYMRKQFHYLGGITGLYYNRQQTEEEKSLSEVLIAGFGKYPSRKKEMPSSIKLLKAALSSKDAYETLYLEFSNKTIQIMKDLRRLHFSMSVGIDLAKFHLQYGHYNEAETLLEKAWSIYKQQKWEALYTDVLIPLATCQLKHNLKNRYINSVMLLSCAKCLPLETRNYYSNELMKLSMDNTIKLPVISTDPVIRIINISIELIKNKGHIGDCVKVNFELFNESTINLPCKSIYVVLKHSDLSNPKSFSDNTTPSLRKPSCFDHSDSGLCVSLSLLSEEKAKEVSKEPLTPSSLLKKFQRHKRTWSRNKNIVTESKSNSQTSSVTSSPSESRPSSVCGMSGSAPQNTVAAPHNTTTSQNTYTDSNITSAKKALFIENNDENKENQGVVPNGVLDFHNDHFTKMLPLEGDNAKLSNVDVQSSEGEVVSIFMDGRKYEKDSARILTPTDQESILNNVVSDDVVTGEPLSKSSVADLLPDDVKDDTTEEFCADSNNIKPDVTGSSLSLVSVDDDIFLKPELEENLDQLLLSEEDFTLSPGKNSVELKAKINVEGRFVLQCMKCIVENLTFYKLLSQLPRNRKSFFMVADPPKIVWTTDYLVDYLLTGSKQCLHVTLLNGPGMILDGSIVKISSNSGLHFEHLPRSAIQIYPLERNGIPRDEIISGEVESGVVNARFVLLRLPECRPYERVNIYFDVVGAVHSDAGDKRMTQHQISFNLLWLKDLVNSNIQLDCIFYEPFQMDYETLQKGCCVYVKVSLRGVNPVPLNFFSPKLTAVSPQQLTAVSPQQQSFQLLSESNALCVYSVEECCILWKLDCAHMNEKEEKGKLTCQFEVNFKTEEGSGTDVGSFCKPINITYTKCLYSIEVSVPTAPLEESQPCTLTVKIKRLYRGSSAYRLFLVLNTAKKIWSYATTCKYHEVIFNEENEKDNQDNHNNENDNHNNKNNETELVIEISSKRLGMVPAPVFLLAKLHEVELTIEEEILGHISAFECGQVEYKHIGESVFYNKDVTEYV